MLHLISPVRLLPPLSIISYSKGASRIIGVSTTGKNYRIL
jgi:hypothetical protein